MPRTSELKSALPLRLRLLTLHPHIYAHTQDPALTMGRRKIEIQPIVQERNRSVTFLKRRNGLFKKAFEIGVLCSVDVAVIIFEGKPGHQKLFQYCSSDMQSMIQRHTTYDGEREMRTPSDFAGNIALKFDDIAEENDDDDTDDVVVPSIGGMKRSSDGKIKLSSHSTASNHIPLHNIAPSSQGLINGLPATSNGSRSQIHDRRHFEQPPSPGSRNHKRPRVSSDSRYRQTDNLSAPSPPSISQMRSEYASHRSQNPQFFPFHRHAPQPSAPLQFDFPFPPSPASSSTSNCDPSSSHLSRGSEELQISRAQLHDLMAYQQTSNPSNIPYNSQRGSGQLDTNDDIFAAFLRGTRAPPSHPPPRSPRQARSHPYPTSAFADLDWPMHDAGRGADPHPDPGFASSIQPSAPLSSTPPAHDPAAWLDFLSGHPPNTGIVQGVSLNMARDRGTETLPWDSATRLRDEMAAIFAGSYRGGRREIEPGRGRDVCDTEADFHGERSVNGYLRGDTVKEEILDLTYN